MNIVADIVHYCVKGIEAPYIRGQIGEELDDETGWAYVAKLCMAHWDAKNRIRNKINFIIIKSKLWIINRKDCDCDRCRSWYW